jgi:hypothetical protein
MGLALKTIAVGALILALAVMAPRLHANAEPAPASASYAAAQAVVNLGELFGDENEPDENEADEGAPQRAQSGDQGSGVSIPVVLVLVALAAALGGYVYVRVRRLVLRVRAWGRGLWARL